MTINSDTPYPAIDHLHLGLTFTAAADTVFTRHKGSTLRNLFDTALYRLACNREKGCRYRGPGALDPTTCPEAADCSYTAIAMPFTSNRVRLPAAYLLKCSDGRQRFETGKRLYFEILLFGRAGNGNHLLRLIAALDSLGQRYFSLDHFKAFFEPDHPEEAAATSGRLRLEKIEQFRPAGEKSVIFSRSFYRPPDVFPLAPAKTAAPTTYTVTVEFITPVHLERKTAGERRLLTPNDFDFPLLFRSIRGRYQSLAGINLPAAGHDPYEDRLWQEAGLVPPPRIRQADWHRIVRRKNRETVNLNRRDYHGFTGSFTFDQVSAGLLSWLRLGEKLHIGKLTTFGYGEYRLDIHKEA